ncbi:MAG: zf-HC2 domain-containing protein [Anaeromyxobacteraceae bacterium]
MIECTHFAPMLTARPGELAAQDAMALERHLDACIDCRALRATFLATEGLLAEGLLARAAERDFAPFTDAVMARVSRRHNRRGRVFDWVTHHRVRAVVSGLVPALAAGAMVVFFQGSTTPAAAPHQLFELTSDCGVTTVLKTEQGPVVLMGDDDGDEDDAP